MQNKVFTEVVNYIVNESIKLKNKHTTETDAPIEFACIFCKNEKEYQEFTEAIKKLGRVVQDTPTGYTYKLDSSIKTNAGMLKLVKIRKPDPLRKERGDADFNTNYSEFKKKYQGKPLFELIDKGNFEMLRLSDPKFNVMSCFSNIPLSKNLNLKEFPTKFIGPWKMASTTLYLNHVLAIISWFKCFSLLS